MSKCPKCDATISRLSFKNVPVKQGTFEVSGTVFTCPSCDVVLGAGVDAQEMVNKTAQAIVAMLRK